MDQPKLEFPFNEAKALEATAEILRLAGGILDRFHVVKCISLAERTSLARRERPICGGQYASMPHGPVPKTVYAKITGYSPGWERWIGPGDGDYIRLRQDVPARQFSESETAILRETFSAYGTMPFPALWKLVHDPQQFPEYRDPAATGGESRLEVEEILAAVGRTPEDIERIRRDVADEDEIDRLLPSFAT